MDLRQLRYFVAVAEELHFSRAAARLSLAQSSLSTQIRALEREIGGPLFVRSTRHVELTPAGVTLLADARRTLASADAALDRARAVARGESGSMTIGSLGPAPGGILAPLLARFNGRHPGLRVTVRAFDFTDTVDGLRERHADCAFLYLPLSDPDLEVTPLVSEQRMVVLPAGHRLARRRQLRPADLADETFVAHPPSVPEEWRDHWLLTAENGRRPPTGPHAADKIENWLLLIANGEGVDTAPAVISRYFAWPGIVYVPLVDAAPCTLAIVRRRDNPDPLVAELITLAVEVAANAVASETSYSTAADDGS